MIGLSDSGVHARNTNVLSTGTQDGELANHVLQYVFNVLTGFRWPAEIFLTFWSCADALQEWGFKPLYCSLDGSANNRAFLKMHFPNSNPVTAPMMAKWYRNPTQTMIFMMDPCHQIEKKKREIVF